MSASQTQQHAAMSTSSPNNLHPVNPVGLDGLVRCHHNEPLNRLTSKSDANRGREFYTCFKSRDNPDKCKFFMWADDLPGSLAGPALPSATVTPRGPSKRPREMEVTPTTPNVSPSKAAANAAFRCDDDIIIISDEETAQNDHPPAKRQKADNTGSPSVSPYKQALIAGSSSTQTSPAKTPKPNQREAIRDDPENPFDVRTAAVGLLLDTSSSTAKDAVTPESITKALDSLLTVPAAVGRLQRKLAAAQQSRDIMAKEIQNLKNKVKSLEETVEALSARH